MTGPEHAEPRNLADLVARAAVRNPDRTALIDGAGGPGGVALTWSELDGRVSAAAAGFSALGATVGDRIVLQLGNSVDFAVAFFGALRAGLTAVPVDAATAGAELEEVLSDSGAGILVTSQVAAIRTEPRPGLELIVAGDVVTDGARGLSDLLASTPAAAGTPAASGAEEPAVLSYPTGADRHPRGVVISHRAILANLEQLSRIDPAPVRGTDVLLLAMPLFHSFGLGAGLGWLAHAGATAVLAAPGSVRLDALSEHRVGVVMAAPAVFTRWVAQTERNALARAFATVRFALSGGAPLPAADADALTAATQVIVHEGYGLAEISPILTTTLMSPRRKAGSVGRPVPGVELWLRDEDGDPVDDGDPGEIVVRGPNLFSGYWPDLSSTVDDGGWLGTGDVGYADEDGDLFLVGRRREAIVVSGFTVYPAEVEAALVTHPAVAEVAVVGTGAADAETVTAFVVPSAGDEVDAQELIAWSGRRLARFKQPEQIQFVRQLPHSATGRVRRIALRDER